jgi:hypothetical protein
LGHQVKKVCNYALYTKNNHALLGVANDVIISLIKLRHLQLGELLNPSIRITYSTILTKKPLAISILAHLLLFAVLLTSYNGVDFSAPVIKRDHEYIKSFLVTSASDNAVPLGQTARLPESSVVDVENSKSKRNESKVGFDVEMANAEQLLQDSAEQLLQSVDIGPEIEPVKSTKQDAVLEYYNAQTESKFARNADAPSNPSTHTEYIKPTDAIVKRMIEPAKQKPNPQIEPEIEPESEPEQLLVYQRKIAGIIQSYLRITEDMVGGYCVMDMQITRDGLILNINTVSGEPSLCIEAKNTSFRIGKLPMPSDDALYLELKKIRVTILAN